MFYDTDLPPKMLDAHREEGRSKKSGTQKTARRAAFPTASPAQRVTVGSEEQQNERAMSFVMK